MPARSLDPSSCAPQIAFIIDFTAVFPFSQALGVSFHIYWHDYSIYISGEPSWAASIACAGNMVGGP